MRLADGRSEFSSCRGFLVLQRFLIGFLAFFWWRHMLGAIQDHGSPTSAHTASPVLGTLSLNPWISRDVPDFLALTVPWAQRAQYPFLVAICGAVFAGRSGL